MSRAEAVVAHVLCCLSDADADLVCGVQKGSDFSAGLWLLTQREPRSTPRVRAVIQFIERELTKENDLIEACLPGPARSRPLPDPRFSICRSI